MKKFNVLGMSCAACSSKIEKVVSNIPGINYCSVNLLTNSMIVEGSASDEVILKVVEDAGYKAILSSTEINQKSLSGIYDNESSSILKKKLIPSLVLLLILMYFSMGHSLFSFPIPDVLDDFFILGLIQAVISLIILIINRKFFINGVKGLVKFTPNMDTLVALGSFSSYCFSIYILINNFISSNKSETVSLYFESAAMIVTFITVGKLLEQIAKGKTTDSLKDLMNLSPQIAIVIRNNLQVEIPVDDVLVNELFVVKPGQNVPVDGVVVEGFSLVNEAAITGESIPVQKKAGDIITCATVNIDGVLTCKATRVGKDTTLSQIISLINESTATKAPSQRIADKVSGIFVPFVIIVSVITFLIWLLTGKNVEASLIKAVSVLVISCPCALGLATPVAIMVGNGVAAKKGILFKTSVSLEQSGKVKTVILDKTGTITKGEPVIKNIHPLGLTESQALQIAYSLEKNSTHPIAKAIVSKAEEEKIMPLEISGFSEVAGAGVKGKYLNDEYFCGAMNGKTGIVLFKNGNPCAHFEIEDQIKSDSKDAVDYLKKLGLNVVMLTGDNEITAKNVASKVGIDSFKAGLKPVDKSQIIDYYKKDGKVIMVGDGINDAPALTASDVGIAIGAGSDIALDSADVVLVKNSLFDVCKAIEISRKVIKNIHQNLAWAFFYNIIGIPVAAGVFSNSFGWNLSPELCALAMSFSSFCVVINALRLRTIK